MAVQPDGGPVLVAADDAEVLAGIRAALRSEDLAVVTGRTVRTAVDALDFHRPAVVVLDLGLEAGRGWELLHTIASRPGTSVVALDRTGDPLSRRAALAAGAADVVGPPLDPTEVALRSRSAHRRERPEAAPGVVLRRHDLVLDVASHEVRVAGHPVALTPQQFAILRALLEARGATLHRSQLLARVAAVDDEAPSERAIDLHVSRLRRRLAAQGGRRHYVESVYGVGYRLSAERPAPELTGEVAGRVLESVAEAVLVVDADLRIVAANRAATHLLEQDDLVGRFCPEVMACRTAAGASLTGPACLGRAALAGGGTILHVPVCVRADGASLRVDLSHTPVRVEGGRSVLALEVRSDPG